MLIIGRHKQEQIIVDLRAHGLGLLTIANVGKNGTSTRIGIECDRKIAVHRKEVFDKIEGKEAK